MPGCDRSSRYPANRGPSARRSSQEHHAGVWGERDNQWLAIRVQNAVLPDARPPFLLEDLAARVRDRGLDVRVAVGVAPPERTLRRLSRSGVEVYLRTHEGFDRVRPTADDSSGVAHRARVKMRDWLGWERR